jgi:hypothetical protein
MQPLCWQANGAADIHSRGGAWTEMTPGGYHTWKAIVDGVEMKDDVFYYDRKRAQGVCEKQVARYIAGKDAK